MNRNFFQGVRKTVQELKFCVLTDLQVNHTILFQPKNGWGEENIRLLLMTKFFIWPYLNFYTN